MELRQITTFVRVAQLDSFSKAAESLGYSQSAVTVQIRQLEEELDTRLFDRMGKKITLTDRGKLFLEGAYEVLQRVNKLQRSVEEGGELRGDLRLGTIESLCLTKLPPILLEFCRLHPKVSVRITIGSPEELIEGMEHNHLDLIYILDDPRYNNNWEKLMEREEEVVFVTAAASPLAGRSLALTDLVDEPFLLTEKDANYRRALDQRLAFRGMELEPFLEISDTKFILKMLEAGRGVSFLPRFVLEEPVAQGRLAVLDVADCRTVMYRQIFCHREKWRTREMEEFLRLAWAEETWRP